MNRICHDIWWGRGKPNLSFGIIKKSSKPQESAGVLFRPRASAGRLVDSVQGFTEGYEATAPWRFSNLSTHWSTQEDAEIGPQKIQIFFFWRGECFAM